MAENISAKGWVYVVVCDPETDASFLGLYDEEKAINFIPAFDSRDAANDCLPSLPRERGRKYEIQAVHVEELTLEADRNGFVVAMVDNNGNVIDEMTK